MDVQQVHVDLTNKYKGLLRDYYLNRVAMFVDPVIGSSNGHVFDSVITQLDVIPEVNTGMFLNDTTSTQVLNSIIKDGKYMPLYSNDNRCICNRATSEFIQIKRLMEVVGRNYVISIKVNTQLDDVTERYLTQYLGRLDGISVVKEDDHIKSINLPSGDAEDTLEFILENLGMITNILNKVVRRTTWISSQRLPNFQNS